MTVDLSITQLIAEASLVVQLVMLVLLLASISSWAIIIRKARELRRARGGAEAFEDSFWSGGNLTEIYQNSEQPDIDSGGMERIFRAGFREFSRMRRQSPAPEPVIEAAQRAMRVALNREMDRVEQSVPFLATVGSTSPYIGLFGTVWGIMNAFLALGAMQQATLATVAPGIAEALIATALGLFAAIPAVIAYNRFANQSEQMTNRYEMFIDEFTGILQRHLQAGAS
ncbi:MULTISPECIES: protein TolQ [Spiribacter]|jgi:biopolymer transport protein TolQ|uniref:Tol-Pal system protein TolQ n=2 Tax=Spiribacter TaxID=1335745 RepID=A0A557RKG6_9GAMM|nr:MULTISPECIES: protein TolQ [Spiribacter]PZA01226.1 protein TolQ [Gammaproteobacteria bacterium 2W06]AUB79339.1 protein TolQ [Spiribacter roseus]KAF0279829.1 protein TolQ [Spiribacter roseus]KAF0283489.1 protein TolQ [Spiribacter roseus]KAF0286281.1 protein TolQ [Spiribacter sp. SSL99]